MSEQVEIPAEAFEAAQGPQEDFGIFLPADLLAALLQAAAPSIRAPLEAEIKELEDANRSLVKTREAALAGDLGVDLDSIRQQAAQQERERLKEQVQPALDAARSLAERVNQELGDYPAYSSAEDAIQEAEAALATLKEEDH